MNKKIICWWSGGITSAVACYETIQQYGKENCMVVMVDTRNEDADTYRFKRDCEKLYGIPIKRISAIKSVVEDGVEFVDIGLSFNNIKDVWLHYLSLNVAKGAICSTELKRRVREKFQKSVEFSHQVFGFEMDIKECNRALNLKLNYPETNPLFPLLYKGYTKKACAELLESFGIPVPRSYQWGFKNNNCLETGCVQGGIGYWQKMGRDLPEKYDTMSDVEHELTDLKGSPVTMLKDQSNAAKKAVKDTGEKWRAFVFLKKHPAYPDVKCLADMKPQKVEPLFECNGMCGINDGLQKSKSVGDINYE